MASEIRVNKITHTAGVGTITTSADGVVIAGIVTANSFSGNVTGNVTGSGANLTNIPAGQLTGTVADARLTTISSSKLSGALPAIDGSNLTGVGLGTDRSANTSGIITATAFIPTVGQLSHRNLIINGAMMVAQRGTSSTSTGHRTVDRFSLITSGVDEAPTQAQVDVSSGTTPYTSGFRKALKVTNGNQTNGAGGGDYIWIQTILEAQDIATSGWNYTSSSSYVTLSFWVKSSVAQEFKFYARTQDGTNKGYAMTTGSLSADTWTKVTKTIPGHSDLQFDNDNGAGFEINFLPFMGTDRTDGSVTEDAWQTFSGSARTKDQTSTWYTTNDATFEITGVQLEVGSVATPFEHRSFGDELLRCQRYCYADRGSDDYHAVAQGHFNGSTTGITMLYTPVCMRTAPTLSYPVGTWIVSGDAGTLNQSNIYPVDNIAEVNAFQIRAAVSGAQSGEGFLLRTSSAGHTWILDAEL